MKGRNQPKKAKNTQNLNASPSTEDFTSSSATEQGLMEKDCVPLTEAGFRRWMIRTFWELTTWMSTQRPNLKVGNYKDDRWINLQ